MAKKTEFSTEEFGKGIALLEKMPESIIALYKNRKEDPLPCIDACHEILAKDPAIPTAYLYLGTIAEESKDYEEALRNYRKATTYLPLMHFSWRERGRMEIMLGQCKAARRSLMQAKGLCYGKEAAFIACLFALSYYVENNLEATNYFLDLMIKEGWGEGAEVLLFFRGWIAEKEGNTEEALSSYIEYQMRMNENEVEMKSDITQKIFWLTNELMDDKSD